LVASSLTSSKTRARFFTKSALGNDEINSPSQQKLARDQAGFDCFAKADIIRDQKIYAGQPQCLRQEAAKK
jgi:hypothetical protein